ncbi:MAG: class I SAM-dependent methyltransferase [Phycisphaerales bacterium]
MKPASGSIVEFEGLVRRALDRRRALLAAPGSRRAFRVFSGEADGVDGVFVDVYSVGAVLIEYEGRTPRWWDGAAAAGPLLAALGDLGVTAVYRKPFAKDRSKLGGQLPECVTDATPAAGSRLEEAVLIDENGVNIEIRLYDGLSTGLFLDQRSNREFLRGMIAGRAAKTGERPRVLNTFAYTCAFSVFCAVGGAETTSVDVSARYLEWGKRNFAHNGLDPAAHRFARMGTMEFLEYAQRKGLAYDLAILDPPSFASGSKKNDVRPWSSTSDYAELVRATKRVLKPGGAIFASTNTSQLCAPGRLEREVIKGLVAAPRWLQLPPPPPDFARERERFAACMFVP